VPPIERSHRRQKAVLWAPLPGVDNYGERRVTAPREILVRWTDTLASAGGTQGGSAPHDATVIVGEEIPVGSIMWLGALADWSPAAGGLMQVVRYGKTPDVKNRFVARQVALRRYSDKLPATG
jgi:hypothetical protein